MNSSSNVQPAVDQPTPAAASSSTQLATSQAASVTKAATPYAHQQAPLWPAAVARGLAGWAGYRWSYDLDQKTTESGLTWLKNRCLLVA